MNSPSTFLNNVVNRMHAHRRLRAFSLMSISIFVLFLYLSININHSFSIPFRIVSAIADTCVLALPLLFLRGRWRYLGAILCAILGVIVLANILYYRNFNDLIPGSAYFNNQITDPLVVSSALNSLRPSDILIAVFSLLPLIQVCLDNENDLQKSDRKIFFITISCILITSWSISFAGSVRRWRIWYPDSTENAFDIIFTSRAVDWTGIYSKVNFTGYTYQIFNKSFNCHIQLSEKDIDEIQSTISLRSQDKLTPTQSVRPDNLIFIVVESFPSTVLKHDTEAVMPVLTKLMADSLNICVNRCISLIGLGTSSDAQFIYNTGLLPLRNDILVTNYAANDYPAIAKALGKESIEIIGEDKSLWSHAVTTKSYGYSHLIDGIAEQGINQDSMILKTAAKKLADINTPFYMFVTTLSMHTPYDIARVNHKLNNTRLEDSGPAYREYMERLHHFDESLGDFIDVLKAMGMYANTCIVITGDHPVPQTKDMPSLQDNAVPLIIINSPIKGKHATEATQLDVFPTILDIMGIDNYEYMGVRYTGLGRSIFRQKPGSAPSMPTDTDYEISEMIIRRK